MIIFLYGEDSYRSREKLKALEDKFLREIDPTGEGLVFVNGQTADFRSISEAVSASSLFSKKRMVVIENIFSNRGKNIFSEIFDFLRAKDKDNIIIFRDEIGAEEKVSKDKEALFSFLKNQKFSFVFRPFSNTEATEWVRREVAAKGGRISQRAAALLASSLSGDLWRMAAEIDKLVNYKQGQKLHFTDKQPEAGEITEEDIQELVSGDITEKIFALTDALGRRDKKSAVRIMEEQLSAGVPEVQLLYHVSRQIKIILLTREGLDKGWPPRKISSALKVHPYVAQKAVIQARNFTVSGLKNTLNKLVEIDYFFKTGQADPKAMLELAFANM